MGMGSKVRGEERYQDEGRKDESWVYISRSLSSCELRMQSRCRAMRLGQATISTKGLGRSPSVQDALQTYGAVLSWVRSW